MTSTAPLIELPTAENIIIQFKAFKQWEDRYRFIMKIGKNLTEMPIDSLNDNNEVSGCESKVWLTHTEINNKLTFFATSEARIVKGLLWLILTPINNMDKTAIIHFDFESYFDQLDLIKHLSPSRGAGLLAITQKIQRICQQ